MKEAMMAFLINREQKLLMFPINYDYGEGWVEYKILYTTEELLIDTLSPEDLRIYYKEHDVAHCLDCECLFEDFEDLFHYLREHDYMESW